MEQQEEKMTEQEFIKKYDELGFALYKKDGIKEYTDALEKIHQLSNLNAIHEE